jgi:hypothetical protein
MIRNYALIALCNLCRQPGYAAINVFGLGVGTAACLLIGLFVWQERTYDRFHEYSDRLSRVWFQEEREEHIGTFVSTPVILAPTLRETFPEVEEAVRVMVRESAVGPIERRFTERVHGVDPAFFQTFIAALGLFALATPTVTRRRKEIGVRKVLGAGTAGIVALLSVDFLKLVGAAFVIAAPVGYFLVSRWLESFAYRIEPGVSVFAAAGVLAVLVAFMAVGYHAFRAATADPVQALGSE